MGTGYTQDIKSLLGWEIICRSIPLLSCDCPECGWSDTGSSWSGNANWRSHFLANSEVLESEVLESEMTMNMCICCCVDCSVIISSPSV